MEQQHRHRTRLQHGIGGAADEHAPQRRVAIGPHQQQINVVLANIFTQHIFDKAIGMENLYIMVRLA